uniref:Mating-type protein MAT-1 n=1 Tax=Stagonosporopsis caricae TaxID=749887 RepID=A0A1S5VK38_9PLEO|nr:MAT1-1-1 [Stagonosporopsis caricae]AQP26336.1 MAT1-1-1 [Stagonosporopsis caricae]AQQ80202.1 MAT1-1-1 [Stagonosporopsis caricae]
MHTHQMAVPQDPTPAEIAHFLVTRSGDQMSQLDQALRAPVAQAALTKSMMLLPPKVTPKIAPPEKAKKALNAFVGFRCYYIHIPALKAWPMKKISYLMGVMWDKDPNKSIWSLLAKAWSAIRDTIGKDQAPLDQFLRLMCPHLNLPSPVIYLDHCGWELKVNAEGNPGLSKDKSPSLNKASAGIAGMALSVQDITTYCHVMGYAENFNLDLKTHSPTFLAQSCEGNSVSVKSQTRISGFVHDDRLAVRDQRRARKQSVRATSAARALQQQIVDTHNIAGLDVNHHDSSVLESMQTPFYDQLAGLLTENLEDDQQGVAGASIDLTGTSDLFLGASVGVFSEASTDAFTGASTDAFADTSVDVGAATFTDHIVGEGSIINDWNDSGAFRHGADEDATLLSFDLETL